MNPAMAVNSKPPPQEIRQRREPMKPITSSRVERQVPENLVEEIEDSDDENVHMAGT
jgi:cell division septation protein DedD